jgi:hypothetical protein
MYFRKRLLTITFCGCLFLLCLFSTKPALAASPTFVQASTSSNGSRATSETITFQNVKAGDLLVGWFSQYDASGHVSVSDNFNGAWTRVTDETFSNGGGDIALYYKINSKAAVSMTITASATAATYLQMGAAEYTGVHSNAYIDQTAVAEKPSSAGSTAVSAGPTTSVNAGELIFGAEITGGDPTSVSVGSSQGVTFVKRANTSNGSIAVEDILSGASGAQSSSFTLGSATDWYSVVATFVNPSAPSPTPTPTLPATITGPQTSLHYTPNSNFDTNGRYVPGDYGFNLTDAESVTNVNNTPASDKALVFLGLCNGADTNFTQTITPYLNNSKVFGYYLMDDPDPTGSYHTLCTVANLKAESDWIHQHDPGKKTFIVLMNLGSSASPSYTNSYKPSNSDIDLYGLDMYSCRSNLNGCDDTVISNAVTAAESWGIPQSAIIPMYQAFGGGSFTVDTGGSYLFPSETEVLNSLEKWKSVVPNPEFDYTYSWGEQQGDTALVDSTDLKSLFALFNTPASTTSTNNSSSPYDNEPNPNMLSGWKKIIMAGPHFVGIPQFVNGSNADNAQNVWVFVSPTSTHDDLYITIQKASLTDLESPDAIIPLPWSQGYNTVSEIYSISAVSSFNGYPDNQLDGPATIILPYTKPLLGNNIFLLEYNSTKHQWIPLTNSVINAPNRTVAATSNYFSYFTVGYRK